MQYSNEMIKTHGVKREVTRKKNTMDFLMILRVANIACVVVLEYAQI